MDSTARPNQSDIQSQVSMSTKKIRKTPMPQWRKLVRSLHRDIGYFCIGMTIIFAVSGIAVNHIEDWNPNYVVTKSTQPINISESIKASDQLNQEILTQLGLDLKVKTQFWESENRYKIFVENETTININFQRQTALIESVTKRPILSAFNRLHLNEAHKAWIIFSDIFAALLLFLAISSIFMLKGKNSIFGIKGLYVLAGILVPSTFILL